MLFVMTSNKMLNTQIKSSPSSLKMATFLWLLQNRNQGLWYQLRCEGKSNFFYWPLTFSDADISLTFTGGY